MSKFKNKDCMGYRPPVRWFLTKKIKSCNLQTSEAKKLFIFPLKNVKYLVLKFRRLCDLPGSLKN